MSRVRHSGSLPTPEDVENLLEAARAAAEDYYRGPKYSYVHEALRKLFSNSLEWLHNDVDPCEILIEALQDERAILDRHNRLQAKALFRQKDIDSLSEDLVNFPLRFICSEGHDVTLPTGLLKPIYQVEDHPSVKKAAREARMNASKLPTPTNTHSKPSDNNGGYSLGKLSDAPSPEHDFPDGNFTLAEMAAFLPQSFKCWDVIDRVLWNGAAAEDLQILINKYRDMPSGRIDINSVYMMMRGQMRKRTKEEHNYDDWESWAVGVQNDITKPSDFSPDSVSVTGFRRPIIFRNRPNAPANPVPFKDLASGVAVWPRGGDALDLTRCVAWCAENPEEEYYYPTDYREVLYECVGGPVAPKTCHTDAQVLSRLRSGTGRTQPRHRTMPNRSEGSFNSSGKRADTQLGKRKRRNTSPDTRSKRRKDSPTKPARHTRAMRSSTARDMSQNFSRRVDTVESEDNTDDEAYQGPRRAKKNRDLPRRSDRNKTKNVSYADDAMQIDDEETELEDEDQGVFDEVDEMEID